MGMAKAPSSFSLKDKLEGQNGSFLQHISTQTGAKVFLRGQGSGYIEPTSKKESFEALHIYVSHSNQKGLESARKLCESLIQTVQSELDKFMASQQVQQPLGFGGGANYAGESLGWYAEIVCESLGLYGAAFNFIGKRWFSRNQ